MPADRNQETTAEKASEKSSEKRADSSPMKADDVMSAQGEAATHYKTDQAKRAEEYSLGIDRGTGSNKWLPSSLEIVDGLKKLVGKVTGSIGKEEVPPEAKTVATVTALKTPDFDATPADTSASDQGLDSGVETYPESKFETSLVTRDDQNRPTAIDYPDGKTNKIEYDKDGDPALIYAKDGSTVAREGDHWSIAKDGKLTRWDGEILVSENGDITCKRLDGRTKVRNVDGSETITEPKVVDGPVSSKDMQADSVDISKDSVDSKTDSQDQPKPKPEIHKDGTGKVLGITYPDGDSASFHYENGHLNKIVKGSEILEKGTDGTWTEKGSDGTTDKFKSVAVTPQGDIVATHSDGSVLKMHADGTSTELETNKTKKVFDANGNMTHLECPDGTACTIKYGKDANGELEQKQFTHTPSGNTYIKSPDGGWDKYDKAHNLVDHYDNVYAYKETGDILYEWTADDGSPSKQIAYADGSCMVEWHGGKYVNDATDKTTLITYPKGDTATPHYDSQGQLDTIEYSDGSKFIKVANGWEQHQTGERVKHFDNVTITEGDVIASNKDGFAFSIMVDGSKVKVFPDKSSVTKNSDGDVTQMINANGTVFAMEYDESHKLKTISIGGASCKYNEETGGYDGIDAIGNPIHYDNIEVDPDGIVTVDDTTSSGKAGAYHHDGSIVVVKVTEDLTYQMVKTDKFGHVTKIVPEGTYAQDITYDDKGKPIKITGFDHGNTSLEYDQKHNVWIQYDSGHNKIDEFQFAKVNADGKIVLTRDDGSNVVQQPDGNIIDSKTGQPGSKPDGSGIDKQTHGEVLERKTAGDASSKTAGHERTNLMEALKTSGLMPREFTAEEQKKPKEANAQLKGPVDGSETITEFNDMPPGGVDSSAMQPLEQGSVVKDAKEHIVEINYPDGHKNKIDYDGDNAVALHTQDGSTWKKEEDGWNRYMPGDKPGHPTGGHAEEIKVLPNGDITFNDKAGEGIKHADGTSTQHKKDGSTLEFDATNKVTKIKYPGGHENKIDYDGNDAVAVHTQDGSTWQKEEDGWHRYMPGDTPGHPTGGHANEIEVLPNGDITFKDGAGEGIKHSDGTATQHQKDGSTLEYDAAYHVIEIKYPNGESRHITYDDAEPPNPIKITYGDETYWSKNGDKWSQFDKEGNQLDTFEGTITVSPQGEFIKTNTDGSVDIKNTDGSITQIKPDKSSVTTDKDGNVSDVVYPNGESRHITYDDAEPPNPIKITYGDETYWSKNGDKWSQFDKEGNQLDTFEGTITVSPQGEFIKTNTDGTVDIKNTDGSITHIDSIIELWGSRMFDVQKDGTATYDVQKGDTVAAIAQDVLKERHKDDPNYKPSPAELQREVDAIVTANNIEDPNLIHVGDKLLIPSPKGHVEKDGDNVSKVLYPDGTSKDIGYEGDKVTSITNHPGGEYWTKEGDTWVQHEANGNKTGQEAAEITPEPNGDIKFKMKASDGKELILHPDGSKTITEGQSKFKTNANGQITEITYPNGSTNSINYDNGVENAIQTKNGSWEKQKDGTWNYYDQQGNLKDHADNCTIEDNGDFSIKTGNEVIVKHLDGSFDISNGKSSYKIDAADHVTEITYPDGSTNKITYANGKESVIQTKNGSWEKQKEGSWNYYDKQGNLKDHANNCKIEPNGDFSIESGSGVIVKHLDGTFDVTETKAGLAGGDEPVVLNNVSTSGELPTEAKNMPAGDGKSDKPAGEEKPIELVEQYKKPSDTGATDKSSKIVDHDRAHLMDLLKGSGVMPREFTPEQQKKLEETNAQLKSQLKQEELQCKMLKHDLESSKGSVSLDKLQAKEDKLKQLESDLKETREKLKKNEAELSEARFISDMKVIDGLPPEKREVIYKALSKIAGDSGGPPNNLTLEQRKELVKEVAHQIAHPEDIKQGYKETCGLATTEFLLAKNHPEKYATYIADLATTGQTKAADGSIIKLAPDVINTNGKPHDDGSADRALASKIFQTATANKILEDRAKQNGTPPSSYVSEMPGKAKAPNPPDPDFLPSVDTGERIIGADGKTVTVWTGITSEEMAHLDKSLTGENYEVTPVIGGRDLKNPAQEAAAEKDFLAAVEKNGLPCQALFNTKPGDFAGMKHEGLHFVTITHIDKGPPAKVYFQNTAQGADHTYGSGHSVPLKEFLEAMQQTKKSGSSNVWHAEGGLITKKKP